MKILSIMSIAGSCLLFAACNNDSKTSTSEQSSTDSATGVSATTSNNMPDTATTTTTVPTETADAGSADFLMKAADGGMAEVAAGQVAQGKAVNESVKMFAGMMVNDHTGANQQVKDLSSKLQVTLPAEPSEEHKKAIAETGKKEGKAFDKAYMTMMVADHKKTIALFKDGASKAGNAQVKDFITATLPKLQVHLDSAQAIQKRL